MKTVREKNIQELQLAQQSAILVSPELESGRAGDGLRIRLAEVHRQLGLGTPQVRFLWRMVFVAIDLTERGCGPGVVRDRYRYSGAPGG